MLGRTNTGGGGGGGLNFDVVAYDTEEALLAATPKENTIGIITTTAISSWIFSATEPETPEEGVVWISVATSSAVAFNALKKNGIQVYPLSAKQYVSGAWVDVTAMSYQGGEWGEWFPGYLYYKGNEFEETTGGLEISVGRTTGYSEGVGTKGNDSIILDCSEKSTAIEAVTANKIDLTNYSTLKCNVKSFTNWGRFVITSTKVHDGDGVSYKDFTGVGVNSLDISGLNGSYYVCVYTHYSYNGSASYVEFDQLWLE